MGRFAGIDYNAITQRNKTNLDATPDGGTIPYLQVQDVILIGGGHDATTVQRVQQAGGAGPNIGTITVTKGKGRDPGTLTVSGARLARGEFEGEVEKFSQKNVVYV